MRMLFWLFLTAQVVLADVGQTQVIPIRECDTYQVMFLQTAWTDLSVLLGRVQTFLQTRPAPNDLFDVFFDRGQSFTRQRVSRWARAVVEQRAFPRRQPIFICASAEVFNHYRNVLHPPPSPQAEAWCLSGRLPLLLNPRWDYMFSCPSLFQAPAYSPQPHPALCPPVHDNVFPTQGPGHFPMSAGFLIVLAFMALFHAPLPPDLAKGEFLELNSAVARRATPTTRNFVDFLLSRFE